MSSLIFPIALWQGPLRQEVTALHLLSEQPVIATGTSLGLLFLWNHSPKQQQLLHTSSHSHSSSEEVEEETKRQFLSPQIVSIAHETPIVALSSLPFRGCSEAVITLSSEGSIALWETTDGLCLEAQNSLLRNAPTSLEVLPDKRYVACSGRHLEIEIVDLLAMKVVSRLAGREDWICALRSANLPSASTSSSSSQQSNNNANLSSQQVLLSLSNRNVLNFWNLQRQGALEERQRGSAGGSGGSSNGSGGLTGQLQPTQSVLFPTTEASVTVQLSKDLTTLLIITTRTAKLYDATTLQELFSLPSPPQDSQWAGAYFYSNSNSLILLSSTKGASYLYECSELRENRKPLTIASFTPSRNTSQKDSDDGVGTNPIAKEPLQSARLLKKFGFREKSPSAFDKFLFSSNGRLLLASDLKGNLALWHLQDSSSSTSVQPFAEGLLEAIWRDSSSTSTISSHVSASLLIEDSLLLVRGYDDGKISLSKLPTDEPLQVKQGHDRRVSCFLSGPPNGGTGGRQFVISGAEDGTVRVWDLLTLEQLCSFAQHTQSVTQLFLHPASLVDPSTSGFRSESNEDRGSFFSISQDKSVCLYSLRNMVCKRVFAEHPARITHLRLRQDQDYLIVGCADGSLTYWEISTGLLEARVYGQTMAEVSETSEDILCDWRPKNIQTKCISSATVPCREGAPIQIVLLNIKRILLELQNRLRGSPSPSLAPPSSSSFPSLSSSPSDMSWSPAAIALQAVWRESFYSSISYLLPWGANPDLDVFVYEDLGLQKFSPHNTSFGIRGALGKLSFSVPAPKLQKWSISGTITALHCLAGATVTKALLFMTEKKTCCSQLLAYFCSTSPQAQDGDPFIDPSLMYLARYWQDPSDDVMQSARSLFSAALERKSSKELSQYSNSLYLQLRSDTTQVARMKFLRTIVLAIIAAEQPGLLDKEVATHVASGLMKLITHDAVLPMQGAAVELIGRGYSLWSTVTKEYTALFAKLFSLVMHSKQLKQIALQALLNIGLVEPTQFVTFFTEEVLRKNVAPQLHSSALMIISSMVKKHPTALLPELSRLVDGVVKSLDPSDVSRRETIIKSTTGVLHAIVKRYPTISFHQQTQRLAAASGKLLSIYDLKTATRSALLKGHQESITACEFAQDGKLLATYSLEESKVFCWQTLATSYWILQTSSQPKVTVVFDVNKPKRAPPDNLLNCVRLEWSTATSLTLVRTWDDNLTLKIE